MGLPQQGVGGPSGTGTAAPGKKVNPNDPASIDTPGQGDPTAFNPNDPYVQRITGDPNAGDHPAQPPPAKPTAPPTTPPATPDPTQGLLSDPGPFEIWASQHAGDFGNPSAAETLYGKYGSHLMDDPSNSETLYSQGIDRLNPYYDYASQIGTKAINDAAAAHGGFSSTALTQIGNLNANLRGQQAKDMANLAKQSDDEKLARYGLGGKEANDADTGKLGRYGASSSLYGQWQDREENRLTGGLASQMHLSEDQAGQVQKFYTNLLESGKYDAESINAALQAAGVDPNSAFGKDLISIGKAYATSYAGASGKEAGS